MTIVLKYPNGDIEIEEVKSVSRKGDYIEYVQNDGYVGGHCVSELAKCVVHSDGALVYLE